MKVLILSVLMVGSFAAPATQTMNVADDGTYQFFYETGQEGGRHSRSETRDKDGVVIGKFSFEDPTGELREVNYRADDFGYVAKGDVGVAGAPQSQFPQEPEEPKEHGDGKKAPNTEENSLQEEEHQQESSQDSSSEDPSNDEEEDDVKPMKLEAPSEDGPPEGFPEGFFLQKFSGLRRLPEPVKEGKPDSGAKPEEQKEASTTTEKSQEQGTTLEPTVNFAPLLPFPNFAPQSWPVSFYNPSLQQQSMYVYSYRQPNGYGYHYAY